MTNHTRYVTRADLPPSDATRASYYDGGLGLIHMPDSCTVMVEEKSPEYTGLRDANGCKLYRMPDTVKIGFHLR
jgi:hypothetical protein